MLDSRVRIEKQDNRKNSLADYREKFYLGNLSPCEKVLKKNLSGLSAISYRSMELFEKVSEGFRAGAMHHIGCVALHHMVQGMAALNLILNYKSSGQIMNLTWFMAWFRWTQNYYFPEGDF